MALGDGIGTSIYMEYLVKIYHHSPTHGPTEHKEYKGLDLLSSFMLNLEQIQKPRMPLGSYKSLDSMLAKPNYNPISYNPKAATPAYSSTGKGCNKYY